MLETQDDTYEIPNMTQVMHTLQDLVLAEFEDLDDVEPSEWDNESKGDLLSQTLYMVGAAASSDDPDYTRSSCVTAIALLTKVMVAYGRL